MTMRDHFHPLPLLLALVVGAGLTTTTGRKDGAPGLWGSAWAQPVDGEGDDQIDDDRLDEELTAPYPEPPDDAPPPPPPPADPNDPTVPPPVREPEPAPIPNRQATETNCTDRIDNDGDSVVDCGDADCYDQPVCQPTGVREQSDALCSDWIDNDGDGALDCDDLDCQTGAVSVCQGFYVGQPGPVNPSQQKAYGRNFNLPDLEQGMSVDEVIGKFGDADGERNDYACSDGVDNDGDGRIDCADFGCRFDSQVTVCNPSTGVRFSVVGQIEQTYRIEDTNAAELDQNDWDTRFNLLQLRALGPIGNIENSFFLVNVRAERTPRLTFALFQLPIGDYGHFVNVNSGGGGLTAQFIISAAKQLLLQPAFFVFNAFEQGNGAAVEVGGPIDLGGRFQFRAFAAGGAGRQAGNIGGRFFSDDNTNYTWTAGAQFLINAIGYFGRFDTPYIYNPVPAQLAFLVGGKYDQRAQERYPAWNGTAVAKWWIFSAQFESYFKRELEFGSWQYSYLATLGAAIWPRHLMLAGDFGEYIAGDIENPPDNLNSIVGDEIRRQRDERQGRAILHWFAYEQTGLLSLRYTYRDVKNGRFAEDGFREQQLSAIASYRF
ncbi:MAG: hypothetical protein AAF715_29905 [Myxococcota bacterium]